MRIALLTNPSAGKTRQQIPFLLHQLTSYRRLIHVETPCPAAVPDALDLLSRQSIGLLIVNGGDGTLSEVLTSLLNDRAFGDQVPPIAIVQGGRTNMTANAIGVPRDVHGSIRQLVDVVRTGRLATAVAPQPVLRVEWSDDDEHQVRYGTFFGAGVIHRATRWMRCRLPAKRQGTAATAALVATLLARRLAPGRAGGIVSTDEIETSLDGESARRIPTQVLMATSLPRILLGLEPFWGEGEGGVRVTSVAAGAPRLMRSMRGILRGRPSAAASEGNGYLSRRALRLDLQMDCGFTLDGEIVDPAPQRAVTLTAEERLPFVAWGAEGPERSLRRSVVSRSAQPATAALRH